MEAVDEGFVFIGGAELAAEIPYGIIIFQRQAAQEVVQFLKAFADLRWVTFVGLCIGLSRTVSQAVSPGLKGCLST